MGIGRRFTAAALLAVSGWFASQADAALPQFGNNWDYVSIDGIQIGGGLSSSIGGSALLNLTVLYDAPSTTYHMWVKTAAANSLTSIRHATSVNGKDFTFQTGNLGYDTAGPWDQYINPLSTGDAEPGLVLPQASKVGEDYVLGFWSSASSQGGYQYNHSANRIGTDPANLSVTHLGPVDGGTFGQSSGHWGIANGVLYGEIDANAPESGIGRGPGFAQGPQASVTGFSSVLNGLEAAAGFDPNTHVVDNDGEIYHVGGDRLIAMYTINTTGGSRAARQIWAAESYDNGLSWSTPLPLFADVSGFTVNNFDGLRNFNPATAFARPEAVTVGGDVRMYFSTNYIDGDGVSRALVATQLAAIPEPASLGLLAAGTGLMLLRRRAGH
jgi:hypothetical protein